MDGKMKKGNVRKKERREEKKKKTKPLSILSSCFCSFNDSKNPCTTSVINF